MKLKRKENWYIVPLKKSERIALSLTLKMFIPNYKQTYCLNLQQKDLFIKELNKIDINKIKDNDCKFPVHPLFHWH